MSATISQFNIYSLHGYRTIKVPIQDNKIVLVGENGTGKSTVANLIYYFLTCQWHKIADYEFKEITAIINEQELTVTKQQTDSASESRSTASFHRQYPRSLVQRLENIVAAQEPIQLIENKDSIISLAANAGVPIRIAEDFLRIKTKQYSSLNEALKQTSKDIKKFLNFQILYLPTYRRIEQDLKAILPELDLDGTLFKERELTRRKQSNYVEIVEFGMEDVEATIKGKMDELKDNFRTGLNYLTGTYLRDVIRQTYQNVEVDKLQNLDNSTIESIFGRIDEKVLPKQDQQSLREFIEKIQNENIRNIENERKIVAYFLLKLIDLQQTQKTQEQNVRDFIEVCNNYLVGKKIVYDNINFKINVNLEREDKKCDKLEMRMLSSGEKQIVSLFSHIYLSGLTGYFVIIDEPELSLSVPWQKRFLPDIINNKRCNGLVAVTHSPFIFQNNVLDNYTHNLEEFVE